MSQNDIALVTAAVLLITAVIGMWRELRKVHHLVNDRLDTALDYIEELKSALIGSDTVVPDERPKRRQWRAGNGDRRGG